MTSNAMHVLWLASLVLQAGVVVVLLGKRMWEKFPMFTAFASFNLLYEAVAFAALHRGFYFYIFVAGESISLVLELALVYEVFKHLFSAQPALRKLAKLVFRGVVVLLVVLAGAVIYTQSPIGAKGVGNAILVAEEAARIIEVGLIMFLFLSSSVFGLHWRQNVFGIALGFGIYTATELVTVTMMQHVAPAVIPYLGLGLAVLGNLSVLIWLGYLLAPERVTSAADVPKRAQLEQWNQAIMELINQ